MGVRYINSNSNSNNNINNNSDNNSNTKSNDNSDNNSNSNRLKWCIDANSLYGYAMMQKLPYRGCEYSSTSLDNRDTMLHHILNTPDNSDHVYYSL